LLRLLLLLELHKSLRLVRKARQVSRKRLLCLSLRRLSRLGQGVSRRPLRLQTSSLGRQQTSLGLLYLPGVQVHVGVPDSLPVQLSLSPE